EHARLTHDGMSASIQGRHLLPLDRQGPAAWGTMDMTAQVSELALDKVGRYLPPALPADTGKWLRGALLGGKAKDVEVVVRGDLARFPFAAPGAKPQEQFSVDARIENGRLDYDPGYTAKDGKAPLWPLLENIQGRLRIQRARLEVRGDSARTVNVALSKVGA